MNTPPDDPNVEAVALAVHRFMSEYLDGYVLIGFVAGTNKAISISNVNDEKSAHGLKSMLAEKYVSGMMGEADQ